MAKIDEKYVESLNNYSKSLEQVVELLQQQVKNKDTDIVETMLKNMDGDKLKKMVDDLKEINETSKKIESKQDKILQEIKDIKKQKESGMFGQVSDPKNKNKIVDGIKVIGLIAGGVLAIGLAFKIIGRVDVLSVIALGLSISVMVATFAYVNEKIKEPDIKKTSLIGGMMIIVASAITVSSWILRSAAPISLRTALSITFTSLAVGSSIFMMSKLMEKTKITPRVVFGFLLLPFLAPIVSMAIVTSSHILSMTKPLDMKIVGSVLFTSLALGIALYGMTKALSQLTWKGALIAMLGKGAILTILIGAVAGGIVLASWLFSKISPISLMQGVTAIFVAVTLGITLFLMSKVMKYVQHMTPDKAVTVGLVMLAIAGVIPVASWLLSKTEVFSYSFALKLAVTGLAIGIAILAISPSFYILKKAGIKYEDILKLGLTAIAIAAVIVAISHILPLGNYTGPYPGWEWSLEVGLSLAVFGGAMYLISKFSDPVKMALGGLGVLMISATIMLSSWVLSAGNYDKYPKLEWSEGVGLSLVAFGGSMALLGWMFMSGVGIAAFALGGLGVLMVSAAIMLSSWILSVGKYGTYPDLEWSKGVGLSLVTFGVSMSLLGWMILGSFGLGMGALALGTIGTLMVANTIVEVSKIISRGNYTRGPDAKWAAGTGLFITTVGTSMMLLGGLVMGTLGMGMIALLIGREATYMIANTIVDISKALAGGSYGSIIPLDWVISTGMLITTVGASMLLMGSMIMGTLGLGWLALKIGSAGTYLIADTIVRVSKKLSEGVYKGGPTVEWAKGVQATIFAFTGTMTGLDRISDKDFSLLSKLGDSIVDFLQKIDRYTGKSNIPEISTNIGMLVKNLPSRGVGSELESVANSIMKISNAGLTTANAIDSLSRSLKHLDDTLRGTDMESFQKLAKFSSTFTTISLIDDMKLQKAIDTIKNRSLDITTVIDDNSSRFTNVTVPYAPGTVPTINSPFLDTDKLYDPLSDLVSYNKNIDKNIQELLKIQKDSVDNSGDYTVSSASRIGNRS
jgi:hypothetical protein